MKNLLILLCLLFIGGCATRGHEQWMRINSGQEAYLREHPLFEFQGGKWRVQDDVAYFVDSELHEIGEVNRTPLLAERFHVPPYETLYFKVDRHTFWVVLKEKT